MMDTKYCLLSTLVLQRLPEYSAYTCIILKGVFTELLRGLGVRGAQVEEVWWSIEETSEWEKFGYAFSWLTRLASFFLFFPRRAVSY